MNRQSKVTLFFICSLFILKFGYRDMDIIHTHIKTVQTLLKKDTNVKIEKEKELFDVPNVFIKSNPYFYNDGLLRINTRSLLDQIAEDYAKKNKFLADYPQCRDP